MRVKVTYSQKFILQMQSLKDEELILIGDFVSSIRQSGYDSLPGRNKPSTGVSKKHANRIKLIQYAIHNRLWHYHVGYALYDKSRKFGDWTSEYVVHYQKGGKEARFVDYGSHPPFRLPSAESLD